MSLGQNIKGLAVEIDGETTGLEAAMKRVGKSANDINKELAEVERGLKFDPGNTVLVAQKQELLRDKIKETEKGLDALRQAQGQVEDMFRRGEIDDGQYRAFQREIVTSESKIKNFEQAAKDAGQTQEKAGKATDDWGDKLKKLAAAAVAAMAIRQVAGAVKDLTVEVVRNADELADMTRKTGMTAEQLQEYQYITEAVGGDLDTLAGAQAKLTRSMDAARKGTKDQAEAFAELGVEIVDANGNFRDSKDVMFDAFGALNKVGNETERDALALRLFGRSAQELNPLIVTGTAELRRMSEEARQSGAIMSNETVTALADLSDATEHARQTMLSAIGTAFAKVAPSLTPAIAAVSGLVAELIEKMAPAFQYIGDTIIPALTSMLTGEGESSLGTALGGVMQIMGITKDIFVMLWPIIQDAVKMFVDFFAGPTGQALIKGLLEAIGAALQILQEVFSQVWGAVQPIVQTFIDFLNSETGGRLIKTFMEGIGAALEILQSVFEAVWPLISAALEVAKPLITAALKVIEAAVWLLVHAIEALQKAWEWLSNLNWSGASAKVNAIGKVAIAAQNFKNNPTAANAQALRDAQAELAKYKRGAIVTKEHIALVGEGNREEVIAPVDDPARSAHLLYQSGLLGKIAALAGGSVSSSSSATNITVERVIVDGSRMSTPDFEGFIDSFQTALRLKVQPA